MKKIRKEKKILFALLTVVLLFASVFWYVNDYYHSDESIQEYLDNSGVVSVTEFRDGIYLDGPGEKTAMILTEYFSLIIKPFFI